MVNIYKVRPSDLLDIEEDDLYTRYCFDEACALILGKLEKGEKPQFRKNYSNFSDMYKQYE